MGLVAASSFNNSILKNPYNFQHFNHSSILLTSDSNTHVRAVKSNFSKNSNLQAYLSLFSSTGIHFGDSGNNISRREYSNGFALIGWDLTSDLSASMNHWSIAGQGSLRIDIQFEEPLSEPIVVILYAEFDSLLEIDAERNVFLDYSS